MKSRTTLILMALVVVAFLATVLAAVRLVHARDNAFEAEQDLNGVRTKLAEIMGSSGAVTVTAGKLDNSEADRRMIQAAAVAGLSDKLQATDTLDAKHLGSSDYSEKPVILRFRTVTLRQVLTFLFKLTTDDPGCRSTGIELSPPEGGAPAASSGGGENWTADLTVSYLLYTPKDLKQR